MTQRTITYDDAVLRELYSIETRAGVRVVSEMGGGVYAASELECRLWDTLMSGQPEAASRTVPSDEEITAWAGEEEFFLFASPEEVLDIVKSTLQHFGQPATSAEPVMRVRVVHAGGEVQDPTIEHTSAQFDTLPDGTVLDLYAAPVAAQAQTDEAKATQVLRQVLDVVREYLPPLGIDEHAALGRIIGLVDPWPLDAQPTIKESLKVAQSQPVVNQSLITDEQAKFTVWAEVEYRNEAEYTTRDFRMGLEAWQARAALAQQPSEVILEHSGCGRGTQVEQLTVRLNPGDKVVMVKGRISRGFDAADVARAAKEADRA